MKSLLGFHLVEGECSEFFQVPEPRRKFGLGIFPSFKVYVEGESLDFFKSPREFI